MFNKLIPMLHKIPALNQLTDKELRSILENVDSNIVNYKSKEIIIRESEVNNNIYIILEGWVGIYIYNWATKRDRFIGQGHTGDVFGNVNLSKGLNHGHSNTIRTIDETTVFKIDRILLGNYLKQLMHDRHKMDKPSLEDNNDEIINTLIKTDLFENVTRQVLFSIADQVEIVDAYEGNLILKEGASSDSLFIIMKGEVDVFTVNKNNNLCVLANLGSGDYFGEQAMLNGYQSRHNASVMATCTSKLIKIPKYIFMRILESNNELHFELNKRKTMHILQNEQTLSANT